MEIKRIIKEGNINEKTFAIIDGKRYIVNINIYNSHTLNINLYRETFTFFEKYLTGDYINLQLGDSILRKFKYNPRLRQASDGQYVFEDDNDNFVRITFVKPQ